MKIGDIYIHKVDGNIIQIESFARHVAIFNPFETIIVFANIIKTLGGYGSSPTFNGYGSQNEIEEQYKLAIPQEELKNFDSWHEIMNHIKNI